MSDRDTPDRDPRADGDADHPGAGGDADRSGAASTPGADGRPAGRGGDPLLEVVGLEKSYGDERVLEGVDFEMDRGDVTVVVGPSGSGKSTMLRCINRLTEPDAGDVYLDGERVSGPDVDVDALRRRVGMVFQDINLFAHLTARENVTLGPRRVLGVPAEEADALAREHLEMVGLADQTDSYPAELSGGQKQRVGIARALAMDPELVLFDEPTSSLDPELTGEVVEVMRRLGERGTTMLAVTHEMGFARSTATEVLFLDDGRVLERGPPDRVLEDPRERRTREFLGRLEGDPTAGADDPAGTEAAADPEPDGGTVPGDATSAGDGDAGSGGRDE